ncbi:ATP-binding protein [Sporosarcina sp. NPDC096371]|uniref:ATP-binding protein n=1 Tax=Sporosarcina sp. NPDC096371 TaxID=3364530 RepID=UPI003816DD8B
MKCKKDKVMKHISFLLNKSTKPVVVIDLEGTLLQVNNAFREEFHAEESGSINQFIVGQSANLWDEIINSTKESEQKTVEMNVRLADGRKQVVNVHLMYLDDVHHIIAQFDVSHLSNGELSQNVYLHAFRNTDSFMAVTDRHGIIRDVNNMHKEFFTLPKEYFIGKKVEELIGIFEKDPEFLDDYMKDITTHGDAKAIKRYERSVDDVRCYHISTFLDCETKTYLIRIDDRTEKMVLEERLAHSGSLSTVGELAASIAHEIRNPMTTLKGFVQLLKLSANDDATKYLSVIDDEIARMESILSEMLILAKPGLNKKSIFSLEVLVDDMIQVMHPKALLEGIAIQQKESNLRNTLIEADADKIKQVLLNLFKNAFEAMSPGGTLTTFIELDDEDQLILNISDTGKGMNEHQMNRVFMPFFTCKPEGTGLGLPFVLKTIEGYGGTVSVESEVGKGTTFIVTFPRAIAHVPEAVVDGEKLLSL